MNKVLFLAFLLHWCFLALSQDTSRNARNLTEGFKREYRLYSSNPITQSLIDSQSYLKIDVGYLSRNGQSILAQDAPKESGYYFSTEGSKRIKKFITNGSFSYSNINQDSVGYTFRNDLSNTAPFYLYAPKRGNWKIIKYALQGNVSRLLLKNQLNIGAGISYETSNGWRSNDPRPEHFTYDLDAGLSATYRVINNQYLGLQANIVRGSEETQVGYQNEDYRNSGIKEYTTWLQEGYGSTPEKAFVLDLTGNKTGSKWTGLYNGVYSFGQLVLTATHTKTTTKFFSRAEQNKVGVAESGYGKYLEDTWNINGSWKFTQQQNTWSVLGTYQNTLGRDYNNVYGGNNYVYFYEGVNIHPLLERKKNNRPNFEIGLNGSLSYLLKANGSNGLRAAYQYADIGLQSGWFYYLRNKSFFKMSGNISFYYPINSALTEISQPFDFVEDVVYRDYYYFSSKAYEGKLDLKYVFNIKKVSLFIDGGIMQRKLNLLSAIVPAKDLPGSQRFVWNFSIGIVAL